MPKFSAHLSMLYPDLDLPDRIDAAARDGFKGVECSFPYSHAPQILAERLRGNGVQQVLINAPPGQVEAGDRGITCHPHKEQAFRRDMAKAVEYARELNCQRIHVMAGISQAGVSPEAARATYLSNLEYAAALTSPLGIDVLIEPINQRDIPGYFLNRQADAHAIIQQIGADNIKVQFDLYHCQIVEGDLATRIRQYLPTGRVGHFQIAGVPQRHEPDLGEVNYPFLFDLIDELSAQCNWVGWIGCEYRPVRGLQPGGTTAGLGWLRNLTDGLEAKG